MTEDLAMADGPTTDEAEIQPMYESMYAALAHIAMTWGRIENAMAALLEQLLTGYSTDHEAFHIYFAPNNTETRFKIVDTLARLKWRNYSVHDLMSEWTSIKNAIDIAKTSRNRIVHSEIQCPGRKIRGKLMFQARLTASSYDIVRTREEQNPRQWPGLSIKDVKAISDRFYWLAVRIEEMTRYWEACRIGPRESLPDRYSRIVERRQNSGPLQRDLKPSEPKDQLQSSGPKQKDKPSRRQRREAALKKQKV
jgi:hypothetical protein